MPGPTSLSYEVHAVFSTWCMCAIATMQFPILGSCYLLTVHVNLNSLHI